MWRLWHGRVDCAIRDLEQLLARLPQPLAGGEFSIARLRSLGAQLLTYVRSNRGAIINYGSVPSRTPRCHDPRRVGGESTSASG